ncbi:MAG: HEAT repeat domain-containing protein [Candidatus Riflebacteria bacterium]
MNNEQQNLVNDLRAPIKSFRIFALEEAIKTGASTEVLQVLQELKQSESDEECLSLINYALSSVAERLDGLQKKDQKKKKADTDFQSSWNSADDNQKMRLLSELPARLPAAIKEIGPSLLVTEKSTVIAARIIRIFCRSWPEDQFHLIANLLTSESLSLRLASLRTIVHMKPELLLEDLPKLLFSEDPQIKALAIRGLVKIDKEEALNHLQALLLSSNLSDRLAAIQNCPFLPFEMVKPVLLKYFSAENHPDLLIRAGWILEMNPDVQVPFKLFEIAERSPAKKAELVRKILNDAVKILEKSGILGKDFQQYTRQLQQWVNRRNALRFTQKMAQRLEVEEIPPELDQQIRSRLNQATIQEAFAEALNWPVSPTVKGRISAYLKGCPKGGAESLPVESTAGTPVEKAAPEAQISQRVETHDAETAAESVRKAPEPPAVSLKGKPDHELISFFSQIENNSIKSLFDETLKIISDRNVSSEVRVAALNSLVRRKISGAEVVAEKLVTSTDIAIATAALEYLGETDPERVFPYLGQCLKVPDVRIKSVALGILKNFDFNQAVSSLSAMLKANDPEQQRMALKCMEQFDFALIRELLTGYLEKCDNESLLEAGLCYFAANPSADNAYCLFKIEQAQSGNVARHAQKLRQACSENSVELTAVAVSADAPGETEDTLKQRYQNEQKRKKEARPAYAYREKEPEPAGTRENLLAIYTAIREFASAKSSFIAFLLLVFVAGGFYTLFVPSSQVKEGSTTGNAIRAGQYLREGTVTRTSGTAVEFTSVSGEKFVFHPVRDGYRMPPLSSKLRVSLVPFRKGPDGIFLARVRAMRQIDSFSDQDKGS